MKRLPIYHEKNDSYRIRSVPNGLWQYEHKVLHGKPSNTVDPWRALARPTVYNVARAQLDTLTPTSQ